MTPGYLLIQGDSRSIPLADRSVHCVVTSSPYFGLRDYGTAAWEGGDDPGCDHVSSTPKAKHRELLGSDGKLGRNCTSWAERDATPGDARECRRCGARRIDRQIGLEATIEEYVATMVRMGREIWRVLRDDGTFWMNLGDSYAASGPTGGAGKQHTNRGSHGVTNRSAPPGLKPKDLCGIPWRVALAFQADGWYLRSDIIWAKANPMPESVTDRPTKSHEYLFLLSKKSTYFWDAEAVREPMTGEARIRREALQGMTKESAFKRDGSRNDCEGGMTHAQHGQRMKLIEAGGRNLRSVWTLATEAFPGSHFATFPRALVSPCIKAGSSERGCCPRCGAGWVREVEKSTVLTRPGLTAKFADGFDGAHRTKAGLLYRSETTSSTLAWHPSCDCRLRPGMGDLMPVPCVVLDPFCGSGTTLVVANALGRHGIGLDLSREYLTGQAQRRLERPHAPHIRPARVESDLPLFASSHEEEDCHA